jgi:N-methylhydantoinase B
MKSTPLVKGDEFLHIQAGAGGFGDPMERSADKVLADVRNELMTINYAAEVYGVVIEAGEVNYPATELQRHALAASKSYKTAYLNHFYQSVGIQPTS